MDSRWPPITATRRGWLSPAGLAMIGSSGCRAWKPTGFFYATGYRFPDKPGAPGQPVPPDRMKPMTKLVVKSQLGSVSDGDVLAPGPQELVGVAFSGEARIEKVEVTVDGGTTWRSAKLDGKATGHGFRVFRHAWQATPGNYKIGSRATDSTGATQPVEAVWNPAGYLYNAIELVKVEVRS